MSNQLKSYECPFCQAIFADSEKYCPVCGEDLNFAVLICSHPVGDIAVGTKWSLYPRDYSIGSGESDDIRISSQGVSPGFLKLIYKHGHFNVEIESRGNLTKKGHCYSIRIGGGMFTLHYVSEMNLSEYKTTVFPVSSIAFSASSQILKMNSLQDVYDKILEAVLRITGLEKAYYFSINKKMEVTMVATRAFNNAKMDERFCEFSESIIHKAVSEENDIVCMDLHKCDISSMSDSMK